jgi:hypothetical protein
MPKDCVAAFRTARQHFTTTSTPPPATRGGGRWLCVGVALHRSGPMRLHLTHAVPPTPQSCCAMNHKTLVSWRRHSPVNPHETVSLIGLGLHRVPRILERSSNELLGKGCAPYANSPFASRSHARAPVQMSIYIFIHLAFLFFSTTRPLSRPIKARGATTSMTSLTLKAGSGAYDVLAACRG